MAKALAVMPAPKLRLADFKLGKCIGSGSFGEVVRARDASGSDVVIKSIAIVNVSRKEQEAALNEVRLLDKLDHPRICRYHASFVEDERLRIVMQYCELGDFRKHIEARHKRGKPFSADSCWRWVAQIAQGLAYLHSHKILHRDMKSQNLFLTRKDGGGGTPSGNSNYSQVQEPDLVIGDLGCSRLLSATNDLAATFIGTPYYLSPEMCNNAPYDSKSDVWAIGVIAYELLSLGSYPFTAHNSAALIMRILRGGYEPPPAHYPLELRERVVAACLATDPADRPSAADIAALPAAQKILTPAVAPRPASAAPPLAPPPTLPPKSAPPPALPPRSAPPPKTPTAPKTPPPQPRLSPHQKMIAAPSYAKRPHAPSTPPPPPIPIPTSSPPGAYPPSAYPPSVMAPPPSQAQRRVPESRPPAMPIERAPAPPGAGAPSGGYAMLAAARAARLASENANAAPPALHALARGGNRVRRSGPVAAAPQTQQGPSAARMGVHDERRRVEERRRIEERREEAARAREAASAKVAAALAEHDARMAQAQAEARRAMVEEERGGAGRRMASQVSSTDDEGNPDDDDDDGSGERVAAGGGGGIRRARAPSSRGVAAGGGGPACALPVSPCGGLTSSPWLPLPADGYSTDDGDHDDDEEEEVVEEDGVAAVSWNVVNPSGAPLSSAPSRVGGMAAGSALQAAGCRLPAVDDEEREAIRLLMSGADEMGVEMPMYLHAAELDLCDDDGGVLEADVEEGEQQQRPSSAAVGWRVV